jgi:hypothetical protein
MPSPPVFIDRLDVWAAAHLALSRVRPASVVYFDSSTAPGRLLLRLFQTARRLPRRLERVQASVADVRGPDGASEYPGLVQRARAISATIRQEQWDDNPVLHALPWDATKTALHLEKVAEPWVRTECLRIRMARWLAATQHALPHDYPILLLVANHLWLPYLLPFAAQQHVRLHAYRRGRLITCEAIRRAVRMGQRLTRGLKYWARRPDRYPTPDLQMDTAAIETEGVRPVIAWRYYQHALSVSSTHRSELFWLAHTAERGQRILLYDYFRDWPPDRQTAAELRARGVHVVPRGLELAAAGGSPAMLRGAVRYVWRVVRAGAKSLRIGAPRSRGVFGELLKLAFKVAYWETVFGAQGVRIHVGTSNTEVAQVLALDVLGAVSVGFQYSISFLTVGSTTLLSAGEDVQFVFSPAFASAWDEITPLPQPR